MFKNRSHHFLWRVAFIWTALMPLSYADVWGYVDDSGVAHIATEKLDDRYTLYFRGDETALLPGNADMTAPQTSQNQARSSGSLPAIDGAKSGPDNAMTIIGSGRSPGFSAAMVDRIQRTANQPIPGQKNAAQAALANVQSQPAFGDAGANAGISGLSRRAVGMAAQLDPMIHAIATEHQLDPALVKAVISVESGFNPLAISHKGARGLMQVMPATARMYAPAEHRQSIERRLMDPQTNMRTGAQILRNLMARFSNNLSLTLAAYNAGEGAVQRYGNKIPPYPETQSYEKLVKAAYALFKGKVIAGVADKTNAPTTRFARIDAPDANGSIIIAALDATDRDRQSTLQDAGDDLGPPPNIKVSRLLSNLRTNRTVDSGTTSLRMRVILPSGTRVSAQ